MMCVAAGRARIISGIPQVHNATKLILAFYRVNGSMNFPRGWIRSAMTEFSKAGVNPPTRSSITWYRQRLSDDPLRFKAIPGIDLALLNRLARR